MTEVKAKFSRNVYTTSNEWIKFKFSKSFSNKKC